MFRNNLSREQNLRLQYHIFKRRRARKQRGRNDYCRQRSSFAYVNKLYALSSPLLKELHKHLYIDSKFVKKKILLPKVFSLSENHDESIEAIKQIISSFYYGKSSVTLDFSACKKSDMSIFSLLTIIVRDLYSLRDKYNKNLYKKTSKFLNCIPSSSDGKTNKYLHAFGFHKLDDKFNDGSSFLALDLISGKKRNTYLENPKAVACTKIANFIERAGGVLGVRMTPLYKNSLEGFVSEVLNNAEDHSISNSEWYVNGIAFNEKQHGTDIIELHLSILNIGPSMYEGFEETKTENGLIYNKLANLYDEHARQFSSFSHYNRESLFMLYMLNEGISRLKYQSPSRGNGTMNFIESFIKLGDFGDYDEKFAPRLDLLSGHSILTCDNKYKPFMTGTTKKISLNKEMDIHKLPDDRYLHDYLEYFPGTILTCNIYLNKEYIFKQIKEQTINE